MDEWIENLKNPPKEYRPLPFWSWNDKLDPEQLKWQINEMEKAGLGGYFMHARGGLQTEYLSEEWMNCISVSIEEGKKTGMQSWCYDEEGWPSGFAGGRVTALGDMYHMRWLELEYLENDASIIDTDSILGIYQLSSDHQLTYFNMTDKPIEFIRFFGMKQPLIVIRHKANPYYLDILNQEVVKAFIEITYEHYYSIFKEDFGSGMPGFFTDEPQYANGQVPWSYILEEEFHNRCGYDLLPLLPALFIECIGYEKVRYDFWSLVNTLYVTAYGEQIFNWCENHNCQFTGHIMNEDNLFSQMSATAGAMPFYQYMHIPGMDWLGRDISNPVIPKQVSSVAAQLDKKFVLTETFALCGWDVSFEELKWIAEWQYVNGISILCQHLESYSIRGLRKRDYPPSLFYQQPWWKEYKVFNDYFAKLSMLLTEGDSGADILLLHPIKSAWIAYNHCNNEQLQKLDQDFIMITQTLADLHLEYHYGDESLIKKFGKVEGGRFIVGKCSYKTVVMPSMLSMDEYTLQLLLQLIQEGGKVISIGNFPGLLNGIKDQLLNRLEKQVITITENKESIQSAFDKLDLQCISINQNNKEIEYIHYHHRVVSEKDIFFLVNLNSQEYYQTSVKIKGKGRIRKLNLENNEFEELQCIQLEGFVEIKLEFLPRQSYVLIMDKEQVNPVDIKSVPRQELKLTNLWNIEQVDLNALTLDYCSYCIDEKEWSEITPVIKIMDRLLKMKKNCKIALKFIFDVNMKQELNQQFYAVIELVEAFSITINGKRISNKQQGYWKDQSFCKVDIKEFIENGTNEIILEREFFQSQKVYDILFGENVLETELNKLTYDTELESIYLIGDFGVISKTTYQNSEKKAVITAGGFVIVDQPVQVSTGDLTTQGFSFFSGVITLSQEFEVNKPNRLKLNLLHPNAVLTKIYIDGTLIKMLPWGSYSMDIPDNLSEGIHKISVELFSGNRNLLGPHHHVGGELHFVGTSSFSDQPGWADGAYGGDIWRDRYCFVKFGLDSID